MDPQFYERVFRLQGTHWWYAGRKRFLDVILRSIRPCGTVLDVGCGPGSMLHYFGKFGTVVGVDRYLPALNMTRTHFTGPLLQGDCSRLPFSDGQFSMVAACEMLYHRNVADVRQAVTELARLVEPGGHLLIVDSAYSACSSAHDEAAHGARRFTKEMLTAYCQDAGLELLHATYAYALLLPVVRVVRWLKSFRANTDQPGEELHESWGVLNRLLICWFALEAQVAGRWGLPCGLSIQILCRKAIS